MNSREKKEALAAFQREVKRRNEGLKGNSSYRSMELTAWLFALLVWVQVLHSVVFSPVRVNGASMAPCLEPGDYVIMEKLTYSFSAPKRGDLIILHYPDDAELSLVKRVIGLPGDVVQIADGQVFVNGTVLDEIYVDREGPGGNNKDGVFLVEEDSVFVLGDNRGVSKDSASPGVGAVGMERVVGKVTMRLYPFSRAEIFSRPIY